MKTTKPETPTTYVEAKDAKSGRRLFRTYYEATPEDVIGALDSRAEQQGTARPSRRPRRQKATV